MIPVFVAAPLIMATTFPFGMYRAQQDNLMYDDKFFVIYKDIRSTCTQSTRYGSSLTEGPSGTQSSSLLFRRLNTAFIRIPSFD